MVGTRPQNPDRTKMLTHSTATMYPTNLQSNQVPVAAVYNPGILVDSQVPVQIQMPVEAVHDGNGDEGDFQGNQIPQGQEFIASVRRRISERGVPPIQIKVWFSEAWGMLKPNMYSYATGMLIWLAIFVVVVLAVGLPVMYSVIAGQHAQHGPTGGAHKPPHAPPGPGTTPTPGPNQPGQPQPNPQPVSGSGSRGNGGAFDSSSMMPIEGLHAFGIVFVALAVIVPIFMQMHIEAGGYIAGFRILKDNSQAKVSTIAFAGFGGGRYWRLVFFAFITAVISGITGVLFSIPILSFLVQIFFIFSLPLILEHPELSVWKCMTLSAEVVWKRYLGFLWFHLVVIFTAGVGVVAVGLGLLVTVPLAMLMVVHAYRDIFGVQGDLCYAFSRARIEQQDLLNAMETGRAARAYEAGGGGASAPPFSHGADQIPMQVLGTGGVPSTFAALPQPLVGQPQLQPQHQHQHQHQHHVLANAQVHPQVVLGQPAVRVPPI